MRLIGSDNLRPQRTEASLGRPLSLANQIIVLNAEGCIKTKGTYDELTNMGVLDAALFQTATNPEDRKNGTAAATGRKPLPAAVTGPSDNDIEDLNRQTGDFSLYKYYAASLGWAVSLGVLVTVMYNAVATAFPRKHASHTLFFPCYPLTPRCRNLAEALYTRHGQWGSYLLCRLCNIRGDWVGRARSLDLVSGRA